MDTITCKLASLMSSQSKQESFQNLETSQNLNISEQGLIDIIGPVSVCIQESVTIGKNVFPDIELFTSYDHDESKCIFSKLDKTKLVGSKSFLKELLKNPSCDLSLLNNKKTFLENFNFTNIDKFLDKLKVLEDDMLWMYTNVRDSDDISSLCDIVYFSNMFLKILNTQGTLLTTLNLYRISISPVIGILTPIVYLIVPYMVLRFKFKLNGFSFISYIKLIVNNFFTISGFGGSSSIVKYFSGIISVFFFFQGLFNSLEVSKLSYKISKFLVNKINKIIDFIVTAEELYDHYWSSDISKCFFIEKEYTCKYEYVSISTETFSLCTNFGENLKCFRYFNHNNYINLIRKVYILDCLTSIKKLEYSYPDFMNVDSIKPVLTISDMWHPSIEDPVSNSIELTEQSSMIITGPNAGGKSTLIKSILIILILSQSICVVPAKSIQLTPFKYINSQINIPDCKGKESLFEAEMYRSKENLDQLKVLDGQKSIIFMDEIFNSTNPIEGIAGAYAILKKIATYKSNITIFTTHYLYLTKLSKAFPDIFINMKMNVVKTSDNERITYPYKLSKGISNQYIALELLKQNNFDSEIIKDALEIKSKLVALKS